MQDKLNILDGRSQQTELRIHREKKTLVRENQSNDNLIFIGETPL